MVVIPPGVRVKVQEPEAGKPLKTTLPVLTMHVGCVIVPLTGADGVAGLELIKTSADGFETQPDEFVTVKVYVPTVNPEIVVFVPVPLLVIPPGFLVIVHDSGGR